MNLHRDEGDGIWLLAAAVVLLIISNIEIGSQSSYKKKYKKHKKNKYRRYKKYYKVQKKQKSQ
jgi:hypothetical protein